MDNEPSVGRPLYTGLLVLGAGKPMIVSIQKRSERCSEKISQTSREKPLYYFFAFSTMHVTLQYYAKEEVLKKEISIFSKVY